MATELKGFGRSSQINSEFSSQIHLKSTEELFKPHPCSRRPVKLLLLALVILLATGAGFLAGFFVPKTSSRQASNDNNNLKNTTINYQQKFLDMVDRQEMMKTLRLFTSRPHVSTSPAEEDIADFFVKKWNDFGFKVDQTEYQVPISVPPDENPNMISIINNNTKNVEYLIKGQLNMTSSTNSNKTFLYSPYLAYTPNTTVEGELVYASSGSVWDFNELKKNNITVKGRIVIMNTIFASVKYAQEQGAIGAIIYSDPVHYAPEGHGKNDTYPNSPWLPPDAVQRLSLITGFGDPYTPLLAAKRGIYRLRDITLLKIPAQTISYRDAKYILSRMGGPKVPSTMKGGLDIEYRFGPLFNNSNTSLIVKLEVNNQIQTKTIRNVIGTIEGSSEPDRIVFIGNHRDAWTFGASDPSSGTSTLMEVSRVLSNLLKQGWRPKRTIKLCSWGGEEMGLFGSNEWIEENDQLIRERGIAYLNTDVAVGGNFVLHVQTSAILSEFILKHTKKIQDPLNSSKTLYDTMLERLPESSAYPNEPEYSKFKYVSDNFLFQTFSGLSTADFSFFYGYDNRVVLYPVYHTQYDTFEWINKFADPEFRHFQSMAQLLGSMLLDLSGCDVLPFSVKRFGKSLQNAYNKLMEDFQDMFTFHDANTTLSELKYATYEFVNVSKDFEAMKQRLTGRESLLNIRRINDQMMNLEKTFMSPYTAMNTAQHSIRVLLFNEKFYNLDRILTSYKKNATEKVNVAIQFQLSLLIQTIRAASSLLKPF